MQRGLIYSIILHTLLLLLLVFGLPWFSHDEPLQESVISVEMLPLSELSNVKPKKKVQVEKKELPKPQPASAAQPAPATPPEPKAETKPETKPEPKPEPVKPEPLPEPKKAEPEPKKPEPKKEEPKKEEPKPKPKEPEKPKEKPKKKKNNNDLDSLLKNLEETVESKEKTTEKKKKAEAEEEPQPEDASEESKSDKAFDDSQPLSLSQQDFIRSQVEKHWSPPVGAKDASEMSVILRIRVSEDGTVTSVTIDESTAPSGVDSSFVRSFNESAVRAVWMSSPLEGLPADKYDTWKDFKFRFKPENF
jgi:outer membrane biosynthesis protein TonB